MDDEQSVQSLPPEQQTAEEAGARDADPEAGPGDAAAAPDTAAAEPAVPTAAPPGTSAAEVASAQAEAEAEEHAQPDGAARSSISSVGERLGQRVAQAGEAAADKVAHAGELAGDKMHHAGEVAAERVHRAGEVAGERVAHASETAGQKVILASEAAEGTVAEAQTRAVHAKNKIAEQAGHLGERIRKSTPTQVRETGSRAAEVVRKNPRKVFAGAGSALVGLVTAVRRRGRRSGGDSDSSS